MCLCASYPPNVNLLFSPRKTSLCFLRPELRPPVTMATRLATARARQVSTSTFMFYRSPCHSAHSASILPAGTPPQSLTLTTSTSLESTVTVQPTNAADGGQTSPSGWKFLQPESSKIKANTWDSSCMHIFMFICASLHPYLPQLNLQLNTPSQYVDDLQESLPFGVSAHSLASITPPLSQSVSVCFSCGFVDLSISD